MKKAYETPSVEMIAFRYRDQVVAASGVSGQNSTPSRSGDACEFISDLNKFADSWGDWDVCDWNAFG